MVQSKHGYPRPQLVREGWSSLDGRWEFAIDAKGRWTGPGEFRPQRSIRVPFAPETPASGVGDTGFYQAVWYRREFRPPKLAGGKRLILHFEAVDYHARVWVNGKLAVEHEGGYTPFHADITDLLTDSARQTLVVCAADDPHDVAKPRGKQDWEAQPHGCWYPRTTGIWQPVWMETVPATRIAEIQWTCDAARWEIGVAVAIEGTRADGLMLAVKLSHGRKVLADDRHGVTGSRVKRAIALGGTRPDFSARDRMLWSPSSPSLIDAELELRDAGGRVIDRVTSYTAMRSVDLHGGRFHIDQNQVQLQMALDQGYWPKSGLTAPDDAALRRDVELAKAMGFNAVRKHQKIENPRFLYWADVLGLMVWEEMPAAYVFNATAADRFTREWIEVIRRDASHPCIVAWVPFNESWGINEQYDVAEQRDYVRAMYHLTRSLDPSRPVIGNDGWEHTAADILTIHDYDASPDKLSRRYAGMPKSIPDILKNERPCGKDLLLKGFTYTGQPIMLTEFGGIALSRDAKLTWGYSRAGSSRDFAARYAAVMEAVRETRAMAGFCYTQLTDCYQETNGLLYMDRTPKFPLEQIAVATRGARNPKERRLMETWRRRVNKSVRHR